MMTTRYFSLGAVLTAALVSGAAAAAPRGRDEGSGGASAVDVRVEHRVRPPYALPVNRGVAIQHHAATPAEAFARGLARLIVAGAESRLLSAQARIAAAEAADREIDNREKAVRTGFDLRQLNREARAAERGPRPSREDLARYARLGKPEPLSPGELDAATGEVSWPFLLATGRYAEFRGFVERFFVRRAVGVPDPADVLEAHETVRAMLEELTRDARQAPPADYVAARRFLESIAYTARQPVE
jgi:hypothetical protein